MIIPFWFIAAAVLVPPLLMVLLGFGLFRLLSWRGAARAGWGLLVPFPVAAGAMVAVNGPMVDDFLLGWLCAWSLITVLLYLLLRWLTGRAFFGSTP